MECGKYDVIREGEDIIIRIDCEGCPIGCPIGIQDVPNSFQNRFLEDVNFLSP